MKKLSLALIFLLIAGVAFSAAQTKFELGMSISYYSLKFDLDTESISYLNIPVRIGWYFWKGFEIEPEIQLFVPLGADAGDSAYFLQGHLLYNFGSGGVVPFIGGGAGVGTAFPTLASSRADRTTSPSATSGWPASSSWWPSRPPSASSTGSTA
ncbi:MAG: hypothetical protein A2W03_09870 [Candidatus Aminicenantes bacterium RBG_16_63_16]|nr:MAG: hypothetical protein A2W03_09870 [Candidatus Aminicenantes bacterium RBG_16_63_16]